MSYSSWLNVVALFKLSKNSFYVVKSQLFYFVFSVFIFISFLVFNSRDIKYSLHNVNLKELSFKFTIFLGISRLINSRIVYFPYYNKFGSFCGLGKGGKLLLNKFGGGSG